ncbi:hypothetical protein FQR65_LT01143 [Abscondita terminalis]|nr:hypothetical protein FQR65_LT01143 [Abscondita terminalis]
MHIQMNVFLCVFSQLLLVSYASPLSKSQIVKYEREGINEDGSYRWSYETDNGIVAQEQAHLKSTGSLGVQGSYQYTAPDGLPVSILYISDENGFQVQGNVLPEPPPIPSYILRALEWNAAHPEEEEEEQQKGKSKSKYS